MGGGTIITYGAACPPPSELPLKLHREAAKSALTVGADFVVSNLTMRREYKAACTAYLPRVDCKRGYDTIEIIVHYPEDKEKQRELAKRVALVHAQTIAERLATLSCPVEQKVALYDEIKKKYIAKSR